MKEVKRVLLILLMATFLGATLLSPVAVVGQKGKDDRPPKEKPKIKEKEKPPPRNSNNSGGNNNRRGKP